MRVSETDRTRFDESVEFASSTIAGFNTRRRYHGLLIAATSLPPGRMLEIVVVRSSLQLRICPRRRCLVEWYNKLGDGATGRIVLQADPSAMGLNKRLANGKSKAEASG